MKAQLAAAKERSEQFGGEAAAAPAPAAQPSAEVEAAAAAKAAEAAAALEEEPLPPLSSMTPDVARLVRRQRARRCSR